MGALTPVSGGLAYLFTQVPLAVILLARVYSRFGIRFRSLGASLRRLLNFGLRAWGIDVLTALALSESVLVVHFLPPAAMGTYVVAASLARMLSVFQTSAVTVLYPRIAARDTADVIEVTGLTARVTTFCAAAGAIAVGALGPFVLNAVYGSSYAGGGSVLIFRLLLGEVVLSGATQVLAQAYLALERPGTVTGIQAFGVGIGWLVMPRLIQEFGAVGAPLGLVISSVIRFAITFLMFPYVLKTSAPRIWPRREDFKLIAARFVSLAETPVTLS
jgi:O-antigen/teichoic acid export membrane protein